LLANRTLPAVATPGQASWLFNQLEPKFTAFLTAQDLALIYIHDEDELSALGNVIDSINNIMHSLRNVVREDDLTLYPESKQINDRETLIETATVANLLISKRLNPTALTNIHRTL
jgi:hypothetical protein